MKLENRTINILKNFTQINPSLLFKPGTVLTTVSPQKTVMAKATVSESFPSEFAIYDLSRFLGVLSLFNQPDIDVKDSHLEIKGGAQKVNYTFANPTLIVSPQTKEIVVPNPEISFTLTAEVLASVQRAMAVLQTPELAVEGDGDTIDIVAMNSANPTGDTYRVEVGSTSHKFRMLFKAENLKLINAEYQVQISSKGIAHFKGPDVEYWLATESKSRFEG